MDFLVKLKTKDSISYSIANKSIIINYSHPMNEDSLNWFLMSESEATKLAKQIIIDKPNGIELEYISVVEMSHYKPLRPYRVVFYREFN